MKTVYQFNPDSGVYIKAILQPDSYELAGDETDIPVPDLVNLRFDQNQRKWNGTKVLITPTADQLLIMAQAQQITTMQQMLMDQATNIAKLKKGVD